MTAVVSSRCNPLFLDTNVVPTVGVDAANTRPPVPPFALPKKLGSDRLLLVSKALHDTVPTYKSISPVLTRQRKSLKPASNHEHQTNQQRRVHFRAVNQIHKYEMDYDESDYTNLWFRPWEVEQIFHRDDDDYRVCFGSMAHTKQILQLWGMCSRAANANNNTAATAVDALFQQAPHPRARGLEHRIITGIRNHRQKAVQSFLQSQQQQQDDDDDQICPRYLKFSQTAGRFAQALAQGDARVAQQIQKGVDNEDDHADE